MRIITNEEIIQGLKSGDEKALFNCIDHYKPYVAYIVGNIIGASLSYQDKEEVIEDVFIKLWQNAQAIDIQKGDGFKSYIGTISRNLAINKLRDSKAIRMENEIEDMPCIVNIEKEYLTKETAMEVLACINKLKKTDKHIFIEYYYYNKKVKDIAREMIMTESAVKNRLSRARKRIREMMQEVNK